MIGSRRKKLVIAQAGNLAERRVGLKVRTGYSAQATFSVRAAAA